MPSARIHFGAASVGSYVFIVGGCEPTSLKYKLVEKDEQTNVYALDFRTMLWTQPKPINSAEHLKEPLRIAHSDVIRAQKRCDEETLRGLSLGIHIIALKTTTRSCYLS
jgi:hypothetical protein